MDEIDKRIVRHLASDGRISMSDLGDAVGLSSTPTARRVRTLEEAGVLQGYSARIDEAAMGFGVSVFVSVRLDQQVDGRLQEFERAVRVCSEVVDCWLMTGSFDYLLRIAVADLGEFESFLTGRLTKVPGVASIESSIPIRRVKMQGSRLE